ncbi:MAG: hypothetical protein ACOX8R_02690 [Bacillota bacterium]|jgi:hypothetical protein
MKMIVRGTTAEIAKEYDYAEQAIVIDIDDVPWKIGEQEISEDVIKVICNALNEDFGHEPGDDCYYDPAEAIEEMKDGEYPFGHLEICADGIIWLAL